MARSIIGSLINGHFEQSDAARATANASLELDRIKRETYWVNLRAGLELMKKGIESSSSAAQVK